MNRRQSPEAARGSFQQHDRAEERWTGTNKETSLGCWIRWINEADARRGSNGSLRSFSVKRRKCFSGLFKQKQQALHKCQINLILNKLELHSWKQMSECQRAFCAPTVYKQRFLPVFHFSHECINRKQRSQTYFKYEHACKSALEPVHVCILRWRTMFFLLAYD